MPDPGEGPSEKVREKGFFKIDVHGKTSTGAHYVAHVNAQGDPGYKATALMMSEAALALALDRDRLPDRDRRRDAGERDRRAAGGPAAGGGDDAGGGAANRSGVLPHGCGRRPH